MITSSLLRHRDYIIAIVTDSLAVRLDNNAFLRAGQIGGLYVVQVHDDIVEVRGQRGWYGGLRSSRGHDEIYARHVHKDIVRGRVSLI